MAGPISHVIYAEKMLRHFPDKDEKLFMLGTLFPDIRALKVVDRDATHFSHVTLGDIRDEQDSFKAGLLFHSIIDTTRETFVFKHDAYANLPDSYLSTVALKICEDMVLYAKSKKWQVYANYLQTIAPQEKQFGIPLGKLRQWHDMHRQFLIHPSLPDTDFLSSLGFDQQQITQLYELTEKATQNRTTDAYLHDFYNNLEDLLSLS